MEKDKADKEKQEKDREQKAELSKAVEAEVIKTLKTTAKGKLMKTKITMREEIEDERRTCLDSGADRVIRTVKDHENVSQPEKMKVEMGDGQTVEMYKTEQGTLVTEKSIQPIIPLVPVLQQLKFKLKKRNEEMVSERNDWTVIVFKDQGMLECSKENGRRLIEEIEQLNEDRQQSTRDGADKNGEDTGEIKKKVKTSLGQLRGTLREEHGEMIVRKRKIYQNLK